VAPLVSDLALVLDHPSRYVRFFALDGVLIGATDRDGATIAKAVQLLGDGESAVRWKATNLLARATTRQLRACVPCLYGDLRALVEQLLQLERESGNHNVRELLGSNSERERLLGLIAALRRSDRDPAILQVAATSENPDVNEIAREWLDNAASTKA
jgi:hypothetical protein